jgi:hypothetical protein
MLRFQIKEKDMKRFLAMMIVVLVGAGVVLADEFPEPNLDLIKSAKVGATATYSMSMAGQDMEMSITVKEATDEKIVYTTSTVMNGQAMPGQDTTIDLTKENPMEDEDLPEGAEVKKLDDETVTDGSGKEWNCQVYEIKMEQADLKVWYSPELPAIFSGGNVKMVASANGMETTFLLKSYSPDGAAADDGAADDGAEEGADDGMGADDMGGEDK